MCKTHTASQHAFHRSFAKKGLLDPKICAIYFNLTKRKKKRSKTDKMPNFYTEK